VTQSVLGALQSPVAICTSAETIGFEVELNLP
jgi:hypothetical protein